MSAPVFSSISKVSTMKFESSNVVAAGFIGIGFVIGWYIGEYLVSFLKGV